MDQARIAQLIINAVEELDGIGAAPSHEVQIKAVELIGAGRVYREPYRVVVYSIEGRHAVYDVLLFVEADMVVSARCPCLAMTSCSHLTAALAMAQIEGFSISLKPGA